MWRSVVETKREILLCHIHYHKEEVGKVHSSDEALVMRCGAKEPYLVAVNREIKDM